MTFPEDDHMVQTVASDRSDQPFHEGLLPRTDRSAQDFLNAQGSNSLPKLIPIDLIAVPQQLTWCGILRKCLNHLLCGPNGCGMFGYVEVNHASTLMRYHYQDE